MGSSDLLPQIADATARPGRRAAGPPRAVALLALLSGVVSCTGNIGSPSTQSASNPAANAMVDGAAAGPGGGETLAAIKSAPMRRLTRAEYNNTVRDLLDTELRPADDFPPDDIGNGFDNQGQLLLVSPLHIELYQTVAERLVEELLARPPESPSRQAVLSCNPTTGLECARQILTHFARRAFRRPPRQAEVDRLLSFINVAQTEGDDLLQGVKLGLQATLISPSFLFRVERELPGEALRPLDGFELGTRLSYLLWSSTPDEDLLSAAEAGTLTDPQALSAQVDRMLASPKIRGFVDNFAGQWLVTRRLSRHEVDPAQFPVFDEALRTAMAEETSQFFLSLVQQERPLKDLLLADYTFANARLAAHYGIGEVSGDATERVSLASTNRRGLLGQGAVLMVTSYPTRTSPVLRGKWVLDQLLCSGPPPPPANVPSLPDDEAVKAGTLREILAQHRSSPVCNACHEVMDQIGLGMEQYDAIGRFHATDPTGTPIDARGTLPDGTQFNGLAELTQVIGEDPRLTTCATEKLLVYALGRGVDGVEGEQWIDALAARATQAQGSLRALLHVVIESDLFTKRMSQVTP